MPSPFPGMDPYLEDPAYWSGFHTRFIVAVSAVLTRALPPGYYADVEQHVWLQGDDPDDREPFAVPDGYVAATHRGSAAVATRPATTPTTETTLAKPTKKKGHRYAYIADRPGNRVITVVELLSPSNKTPSEDRDNYLSKRQSYILSATNLVELDLLRDGERLPVGRPRPPRTDYSALVSRADCFPRASVWAFGVREPLPVLPIPLKPEHGSVTLDLRACLDRAYDDGGYDARIDYTNSPYVPLAAADAAWAAELLKNRLS